jgi:hypothetical protein
MRQLAQANYSQWRQGATPDQMQGFRDYLDEVNAVAEASEGFVWRYINYEGDPDVLSAFGNPRIIFNMSVWETIEHLKAFVFRSRHSEVMKQRATWFDKLPEQISVMWWVPAGHIPSVREAKQKLDILNTRGPCAEAFTFARPF